VSRSRWKHLSTEQLNPLTRTIDTLPAGRIVETMVVDSQRVLRAVRRQKREIARAAELLAHALLNGGRMLFVGAGTSGRLGVLEAAELPPTFGIDPKSAVAIIAGGHRAVYRAREGVEDDEREGRRSMRRLRPRANDVVIGITASGVTPFVAGALLRARASGSQVIVITSDPRSPLRRLAEVAIVLSVGPEVIGGSTRLKAGTATKLVLNMLTTTAMVLAGKTLGNLMVDVRAGSAKLRDRARRIISSATGLDDRRATRLLERSRWNVKAAILMHEIDLDRAEAVLRLRAEPRLRKHLIRR
jgi:N-acetylmuramic acid 6-phosphate etherase